MIDSNDDMRDQQIFWTSLQQFKFDLIYFSLHFNLCISILRWIKYISVGITAIATGVWMSWNNIQQISIACAIIIIVFQAFNALSDLLPYENRKLEIREMTNELDDVYIKMEADWRKIADGEYTISEIRNMIKAYAEERSEIQKHYFKNDSLPLNKKIEKSANDKVVDYFNKFK